MNSFWTVVGFTARNKMKGKAFIVTTIIIALLMTIFINLPFIFSQFSSDDEVKSIGYIHSEQAELAEGSLTGDQLKTYFETQDNAAIKLAAYEDAGNAADNEKQLKKAIENKEIEGYLEFGAATDNGFPAITYKSEKLMDFEIANSLQNALQIIRQVSVLQDAGLTDAQVAMLNTPIKIATVQISAIEGAGSVGSGKTPAEQAVNMGLIYFIIILLFMAIMISGQLIASEITAEKSSRVMEILITSVSPLKQMFGKIFGMFLVIMLQLAVYGIVIAANLSMSQNQKAFGDLNINISEIEPMLLIYAALYFLLGFFLYATLFAAVGSIVSRTEELGQAVMPITILSMVGFYIPMFSISNPETMLVKITSFIPFFSPFVMSLRLGLSDPQVWEVLLSLGILVVSIYIAAWISAKIYRTGVLMYGKRPSWKEIRKAMKAYKI